MSHSFSSGVALVGSLCFLFLVILFFRCNSRTLLTCCLSETVSHSVPELRWPFPRRWNRLVTGISLEVLRYLGRVILIEGFDWFKFNFQEAERSEWVRQDEVSLKKCRMDFWANATVNFGNDTNTTSDEFLRVLVNWKEECTGLSVEVAFSSVALHVVWVEMGARNCERDTGARQHVKDLLIWIVESSFRVCSVLAFVNCLHICARKCEIELRRPVLLRTRTYFRISDPSNWRRIILRHIGAPEVRSHLTFFS